MTTLVLYVIWRVFHAENTVHDIESCRRNYGSHITSAATLVTGTKVYEALSTILISSDRVISNENSYSKVKNKWHRVMIDCDIVLSSKLLLLAWRLGTFNNLLIKHVAVHKHDKLRIRMSIGAWIALVLEFLTLKTRALVLLSKIVFAFWHFWSF